MKHYTSRLMAVAAVVVAFALPANAQINPATYYNVDWQFNAPLSNSFAGKASGWGMNFEAGCYPLPDLAVGLFLNYQTNNEYVSRRTIPVGSTSLLTTDQQHSLFQLPFGLSAHYRLNDGMMQPYIGLKMGANYAKMSSEFSVYEVKDNTWGFYASPEIGVRFYPWSNGLGFHLAAYYSYATNQGSVFDYHINNLTNLGFRLGVAF